MTCRPAELPELIEVDMSALAKGISLKLIVVKQPNDVTAATRAKANLALVSVVATVPELAVRAAAPADAKALAKG